MKNFKGYIKKNIKKHHLLYYTLRNVYQFIFRIKYLYLKPNLMIMRAQSFHTYLKQIPLSLNSDCFFVERQTDFAFLNWKVNKFPELEIIWNLTPGYEEIINKGLFNIKKEIENKLKSATGKKKKFYISLLITLDSMIYYAERYARKIMEEAESTRELDKKKILEELARLRRHVPLYPARNFKEALQSLYFVQLIAWHEGNRYLGLGRIDQYLFPYFRKDIDKGVISNRDVLELLKEFWERLNDDILYRSNDIFGDSGQTVTLGGAAIDGKDATNELSYICLEASAQVGKPAPNIKVRVHRTTPYQFIKSSCKLAHLGKIPPTFCNDEVIISALEQVGYSKEHARNYTAGGCWEPIIPGRSFDRPNVGKVVFLKCLEAAVNDGESLINGKQIGLSIGSLFDYNSFDELMAVLKKQIIYEIENIVKSANKKKFFPSGVISILMHDCIEKGSDISEGACRYNNWGILGASLANTADSLAVIKKFIFEDKRFSPMQFLNLLKTNYKGNENIRQLFLNEVPKFGNDNDYVDLIAKEIGEFFCKEAVKYKTRFDGCFKPALASENGYVETSIFLGASADGRKATSQYGPNFSPALGNDRLGPTAAIKSCTKLNLTLACNSAITDLTLHPSAIDNENGLECFVALIKGFIELGGFQIQFNIVGKDTLIDAQRNPEKYPNLMVRVWGFSAPFIRLPRAYQDQIIARTIY